MSKYGYRVPPELVNPEPSEVNYDEIDCAIPPATSDDFINLK